MGYGLSGVADRHGQYASSERNGKQQYAGNGKNGKWIESEREGVRDWEWADDAESYTEDSWVTKQHVGR